MRLTRVLQCFSGREPLDIDPVLDSELGVSIPGMLKDRRIAVAVGSRGIDNLPRIVSGVVRFLRAKGADPFIIPAMGSHGGATADGQRAVLESLGISSQTMGVPVLSSMDTVEIPAGDLRNRIFMDRHAYQSDGVILINRVKPHTDYRASFESGLVKMAVIGLGKHEQAREIHRYGLAGLVELLPRTAERILDTGKILLGIAVVENARDQICLIKAIPPQEMIQSEPGLLNIAYDNMPSLPVDDIDILMVDQLGKNISGTGIDPNIIGRLKIPGHPDPPRPRIKMIIINDLTEESHGNAAGIGLGDIITRRLYDKIDPVSTYENVITSNFLERAKIPLVAENPRRAVEIARRAAGPLLPEQERIVRIKNTLSLEEIFLSPLLVKEARDQLEEVLGSEEIFDPSGELLPFQKASKASR